MDLFNLPLTPYGAAGGPVRQLRRLRRWMRPRAEAATVMEGDANFVDVTEGPLNLDSGRQEFADEVVASAFSRLFGEFADIFPHGDTRVQHLELMREYGARHFLLGSFGVGRRRRHLSPAGGLGRWVSIRVLGRPGSRTMRRWHRGGMLSLALVCPGCPIGSLVTLVSREMRRRRSLPQTGTRTGPSGTDCRHTCGGDASGF